jgi:hypothetical protein
LLTPEKVAHARKAIDSGEQSVTGMAKLLEVHRVAHKALKRFRPERSAANRPKRRSLAEASRQ